jgi:hypothetical protein
MDEERQREWDIRLKAIGLLVLVASGSWTLYKFRSDRQVDIEHQKQAAILDAEAKKQELNKYIFERQAALYFEASQDAGILANSRDPKRLAEARDRFAALVNGEMTIVEDRRIELAMFTFRDCLDSIENKQPCKRYGTNQKGSELDKDLIKWLGNADLPGLADDLSACIRDALQENRGIQFSNRVDNKAVCPYS